MHFTFDDATHEYRLADGWRVETVTEILADNGLIPDYRRLDPWYAERGGAVHHGLALHVMGRLDWESVDEAVRPYIERGARFLETLELEPLSVEQPWVHKHLHFGGTWDLFGISKTIGPVFLDWKGGQFEPGHAIQVAAYVVLMRDAIAAGALPIDMLDLTRARLLVVPLTTELPAPVRIRPAGLENLFMSALSLTRWRRAHKVRQH